MNYYLNNEYLSVIVSSYGAEIVSVKNSFGEEYIWQADPNVWPRHAPILFPYVGKLQGDILRLEEHELQGYKQHGFARDSMFEVVDQGDHFVTLTLNNQMINLPFPFDFEFTVTYSLSNNLLNVSFVVDNKSDTTMPFSLGYHPAFSLQTKDLSEYSIVFDGPQTADRLLLEDGLIGSREAFLDKADTVALSRELFERDALIFDTINPQKITLNHSVSGEVVSVYTSGSWPQLGIWTLPIDSAGFVCIEPWHGLADNKGPLTQFKNKQGITILESGDRWMNSLAVSFGRRA